MTEVKQFLKALCQALYRVQNRFLDWLVNKQNHSSKGRKITKQTFTYLHIKIITLKLIASHHLFITKALLKNC
jgi:hypothetical protein